MKGVRSQTDKGSERKKERRSEKKAQGHLD